jgi:hypothetical protein
LNVIGTDYLSGVLPTTGSEMVRVSGIRRTCIACPAQWEGETESGNVYIKFRWGHLSVRLGPTIEEAVGGGSIFEWDDADGHNGFMEYDELKRIAGGVLELPFAETNDDTLGNPARSSVDSNDRAENG